MDKICILILVVFTFVNCSKDKTPLPPKAKEEFEFTGKDTLLIGIWDWEFSYTRVKEYWSNSESASYGNKSKVTKTNFNTNHQLEIKKNGTLIFHENNKKTNEIFLINTRFMKYIDTNNLYIIYAYNDFEAFISFFIYNENDSLKIKVNHSFLNFPIGDCSNNHQPISHNYFKIL